MGTTVRGALLSKASSPQNYKFIIDNVDKNTKPSFQRDELKRKSHHCVHGYSVQDRIDTSLLSDKEPQFRRGDPLVMLSSPSDISGVKNKMVIFVERFVDIYRLGVILYDSFFAAY